MRPCGGRARWVDPARSTHGGMTLIPKDRTRRVRVSTRAAEHPAQVLAGVALLDPGDLLGRAGGDDAPAALAAFGPEVDDPVGALDDVEVVLDDDKRVARVGEAVEDDDELSDVLEVQAGGGLVEDVERVRGGRDGEAGRSGRAVVIVAVVFARALFLPLFV